VNGKPDFGPDKMPGTADDLCTPAFASWFVSGPIGTVFPPGGLATTLTAALPPGATQMTGAVVAGAGGQTAFANVVVNAPSTAPQVLVLEPTNSTLTAGDTQPFSAFSGPAGADYGPDGIPGTDDDLYDPVSVDWSTSGQIGTVSPSTGQSTTLTSALPTGSVKETGQVVATLDRKTAAADVTVDAPRVPIVEPASAELVTGDTDLFTAYSCPFIGSGADFGPDGIPGTDDDLCEPGSADWSTNGQIGTVSPATGSSTTLTSPGLPPGGVEKGQVVATFDGQTAAADVTVVKPPVFTDAANQEVGSVQLYDGDPAAVPPDARYTVVGPDLGVGDVAATLDSLDANGDPIESYDLTLRPGSSVRSDPIVPVLRGGPIPSGPSGGLLFVAAEAGGSLVVNVPGFAPVEVTVKAVGQPSVEIGPDATDPTKTELRVVGPPANDSIDVRGRSGPVDVVINGVPFGRHAPTGRIVIHGLGGDDTILVGGVFYPRWSWVYGGAGNDQVTTHAGSGVLLGGADDDRLVSGSSRDLVIGGLGADALFGQNGDDILVGGQTSFDANIAALSAIIAEWSSTRSYSERIANLTGGGLLGGADLNAGTVSDDGSVDALTGGRATDWFFAGQNDTTDARAFELIVKAGG
jgi:hypothetical protein